MPKKAKSTRRKKRVSTTAKISHQLTKIKEETRATMRCIPFDQSGTPGGCVYCGKPAPERAIFARAY